MALKVSVARGSHINGSPNWSPQNQQPTPRFRASQSSGQVRVIGLLAEWTSTSVSHGRCRTTKCSRLQGVSKEAPCNSAAARLEACRDATAGRYAEMRCFSPQPVAAIRLTGASPCLVHWPAMLTLLVTTFMAVTPLQVSDSRVHAAGSEVAVRCMGNRAVGKPLVVLEAGGGAGFDTWSPVQSSIAEFVRVCGYDRPTLIRGTTAPRASSSPANVVRTLREVLSALGELPPYIMVGHSYGGMIVRLYATTYPKEVSGLVLVDSTHEDLLSRFDQIDPEAARELRSPADDEAVDLVAFSEALNAHRWRSTIPLVVLTHGRTPSAPAGRQAQADALDKAWVDLQRELATRSPSSTHVIAKGSGHYIHTDEPNLVIDAVRKVLASSSAVPHGNH
jgi:pimeloyl-ACP methyl ester carboxylesterase